MVSRSATRRRQGPVDFKNTPVESTDRFAQCGFSDESKSGTKFRSQAAGAATSVIDVQLGFRLRMIFSEPQSGTHHFSECEQEDGDHKNVRDEYELMAEVPERNNGEKETKEYDQAGVLPFESRLTLSTIEPPTLRPEENSGGDIVIAERALHHAPTLRWPLHSVNGTRDTVITAVGKWNSGLAYISYGV